MTKEQIIEEIKQATGELNDLIKQVIKDGVYPVIEIKTMFNKQTKTKFTFQIFYKGSILVDKIEAK